MHLDTYTYGELREPDMQELLDLQKELWETIQHIRTDPSWQRPMPMNDFDRERKFVAVYYRLGRFIDDKIQIATERQGVV